MQEAMKSAGHTTAHAVWSISGGEVLIPIYQHQKGGETPEMVRLCLESTEISVETGKRWLDENEHGSNYATFVYDGYLTIDDERTDALFVQTRHFAEPNWSMRVALPYRSVDSAGGFAVMNPKLLGVDGLDEAAVQTAMDAFFDGVESHEQGYAVMTGKASPEGDNVKATAEAMACAPAIIFMMVAAADGEIEDKEIEAFRQHMVASAKGSPMLAPLVHGAVQSFQSTLEKLLATRPNPIELLQETSELMDAELGEVSPVLKRWLLTLAQTIAQTNAKGWFKKKVRAEEQQAVDAIAMALGVQL